MVGGAGSRSGGGAGGGGFAPALEQLGALVNATDGAADGGGGGGGGGGGEGSQTQEEECVLKMQTAIRRLRQVLSLLALLVQKYN